MYLLENGADAYLSVSTSVAPDLLADVFGVQTTDMINTAAVSFFSPPSLVISNDDNHVLERAGVLARAVSTTNV